MINLDSPKSILITGATGGIGRALAITYAEPGVTLILQGRREAVLMEVAAICQERGALVMTKALDLQDRGAWIDWLKNLCDSEITPELAIINAGVNIHVGSKGEQELWSDIERLVVVNILGAMATVEGLLPAMRRRGSGQIALISSLAAWFGLPITPSYSASKAAVKAYGESLRGLLAGEGIRVNVVMPGYVESAMCDAMPGPKPFLWNAKRAAIRIRKGLQADNARISFPFPLNLGTWLLAVMPPSISLMILGWLGYGVKRD